MNKLIRWFLCFVVVSSKPLFSADEVTSLKAGAAAVDVTPTEFPLDMPGGFNPNPATEVHDPFFARCLVLNQGTTKVAIVVLDNLGAAPDVLDEAKQIAERETGIPSSNMLIASTHTHSGPPSNAPDGKPAEVAYRKLLVRGLADSIAQANASCRPAAIGFASHPLSEEVFNRRWYLKPGKMPLNPFGELDQVKMNPGTNPEVLDRPAGPTDPNITILSVRDTNSKPLALLANYSLHYVGATPNGQLSADYFGEFARLVPNRLKAGPNFVAMMSNGTSGDINNIPFMVNRPPREPFEQIRIVAQKAADTVWLADQKIENYLDSVKLGMVEQEIQLAYRRPTEKQIEAAKSVLAVNEKDAIDKLPRLAQHYARRTIDANKRKEESLTIKLQAIRIGDFAVCGIPFETFVEIGLELKDSSPFQQTMVIGLANGRHGYLPTPEHHRLGGYETWLGTNLVERDSSVIITRQLNEMLDELHRDAP